jgi:tRNA-binding EMAP/Myf-like protein
LCVSEEKVDASRLDLRIGKIVKVQKHPDADALYLEESKYIMIGNHEDI